MSLVFEIPLESGN